MPSLKEQGLTLPPPRETLALEVVPTQPPQRAPVIISLSSEPPNLSRSATARTLQAAISAAEMGNTRDLFALYRDALSYSHLQAEWNKRLLAVVSEQPSILPADKKNADDVHDAHVVRQAIEDCENFPAACIHLLSAFFWPVAVTQKVFRPANDPALWRVAKVQMQYTLRRIEPVNPTVLCFQPGVELYGSHGSTESRPTDLADVWEPELALYYVDEQGMVQSSLSSATPVNQLEHIVHRGHLLTGVMKDCFGGPGRAALGWVFLALQGRDWFARGMERYGAPFPVAKTNAENTAAVQFLHNALSLSTKIGGLVVDENTMVELVQAMHGDMAGGYEKFLNVCNRHISIHIVGQTTSSEAQPTGLGSGVAKTQGQVREDIARFDRTTLAATLKEQLFKWILRFNGCKGSPPNIVWGGLDPDEAKSLGALLVDLKNAQLQPTDDALPMIGEKMGFEIERMAPPPAPSFGGGGGFGGNIPLSAAVGATLRGAGAVIHPSDTIARRKAAALAQAFRGDLAPVVTILNASAGPEEFLRNLGRYFSHWKPDKVNAVAEEALQLCAAAGASEV